MLAAAAAALVQGFAGSERPSHASLGSARSAVSMATGNPIGAILEKMGIDIPGPDVSGLAPQGVVITGGAGGVGYAYADSFMARGHNVVICDVKDPEAAVAALQQKHAGGSGKVYGCVCDVSKTESVEELGRFAKEKLGTINHWINNAGINGGRRPFTSVPTSMVEAVVNVNLVGVLLCTKVALDIMQQQAGVESHIFNTVGSGVKGGGTPGYATYGATKRGLPQLTDSLVAELEPNPSPSANPTPTPTPTLNPNPNQVAELEKGVPGYDLAKPAGKVN